MAKVIDWESPEYPVDFRFEEIGDIIEGTLVALDSVPLPDRNAPYATIATDSGLRTVWLGTVLQS